MAAAKRPTQREADELPILDPDEMNAAVKLPDVVDPPQTLMLPVPDETEIVVPTVATTKRVQILKSEQSVHAGGAHYTTLAGAIMELPSAVADDMIAQRIAKEI